MLLSTLLLLCFFAFLAGFIDAMVGGGGLVQVPAALVLLPNLPATHVLGTLKISAFSGTSMAAFQYAKRIKIRLAILLPIAITASLAAFMGSYLAAQVSNATLKPIMLVVFIAMAAYVYTNKGFGSKQEATPTKKNGLLLSVLTGTVIGLYDGFVGPGTGSFLILLFVTVMGYHFLQANTYTKLVNAGTNFGSIVFFASHGYIHWNIALPMAVANIAGNYAGVQMAFLKGNSFVRKLFPCIIIATIVRFGWDVLKLL